MTLSPLISILTPVYEPDPAVLDAAIRSVRDQTYPRWQLCLVDDASPSQVVREVIERHAREDPRVVFRHRSANGGIVEASNDALALAAGDFVGLLDHDDLLHCDALAAVVHLLAQKPHTDVIYTDEDKVSEDGSTFGHAFHKPAWSPEYLRACNYLSHLTVYRTVLVDAVGGFRPGFEGSQDWDLALRVTELTDRVEHIRRVLYHWRISDTSTASGTEAKPYVVDAGARAVTDHLLRTGRRGLVEEAGIHGYLRVPREPVGDPLVSIVIPTRAGRRAVRGEDTELVTHCLRSVVQSTDYPHYELIIVLSPGTDPTLPERLREVVGEVPLRFAQATGPFNFSRVINLGASMAQGEHLLMFNDDIEVINPDWLRRMVGLACEPGIGAVGAKLYFEDGTLQHAGVLHMGALPGHLYYCEEDGPGYYGALQINQNYSAVTGAVMLTPRAAYDRVGGLSEQFPLNFNDIDYCNKLTSAGLSVVWTPDARLFHFESSTRKAVVTQREVDQFRSFWTDRMWHDPWVNPERV